MRYTFNSVLNNIQSYNDKKLAKCEIVVCHDGLNYNNSEFDMNDILRCAEKSLRYSPILGSIIKDEDGEDRLNGHDTELELIETSDGYEVEFRHIERIYGFVPAEANIRVENINDRNYLITEGYIWKHYMDNLEGIFERNAGNVDVSMEIEVSDYSITSDGICKIKEFDFTGITMLGVAPAMEGANLQMSNFSMENLKTQMEELCKVYSLEVEGGDIVEERIEVMEEQVEVCPECDKQPCECEVVEEVKEEEVVEEVVEESVPQVEEEPIVIQIKQEETIQPIVEEPIKETVEHTEAVVFSEKEELVQEGEVKEELQVETQAEETELKEIEKEVEIEDIKPADEDLRERAQAIIDASKREKEEKEEEEKNKKKDKKKKKAKKRKKRILLTILFILLFLILACGGLVAAHYFGLLKNYKFMNPISEKLSYYIKPKAQELVVVVVETPTETIVEEIIETTESSTETILEEVQANPIPAPKPIKNNTNVTTTTKKSTTKQEKKEETPQQPIESTVDNSPVVVQNYSKLGCDVVCGSFKDKAQAEKKARKAKSLGYDSYIINRVQGGEQVYYVSYGSRRSLDEANRLAVKIKEKIGGDFYVISR